MDWNTVQPSRTEIVNVVAHDCHISREFDLEGDVHPSESLAVTATA